ncbi:Precorrin-6A reductase [Candidatus Johnevansia muelleri]|uniref:Precorrin-6A reductase n=1 Tax=Candidatus Johnevansia muelleri TaxID=1495769 RepID=A0A078KE85_9GAMM|nr:Precorrin-6A reductase [Candidatus Evansia muelleri]
MSIILPYKILILGGTYEARKLLLKITSFNKFNTILSLYGSTIYPIVKYFNIRIGGFGGSTGLSAYIYQEKISAVIIATHPFSEIIFQNIMKVKRATGIPIIHLIRPYWKYTHNKLINCKNIEDVLIVLNNFPTSKIFLTLGRNQIKIFEKVPQHFYLIRSIDPINTKINLPKSKIIFARGPFYIKNEIKLIKKEAIDVIVTKNSGGTSVLPKINAARILGIPIIMIERPYKPFIFPTVTYLYDVINWLKIFLK